ncbi:MAG: DNA alkylation repair protein [Chitinophagaceae bacterium]|nr:DNA alkylation repair protein [Chitinophagaceae bacterium]
MNSKDIIQQLKALANPVNVEGMKRFAIGGEHTLGISLPVLRNLSKDCRKHPDRHTLAHELWQSGIHEAMILASMVDHPKQVTPEQMDAWTKIFYSWDLCDQVCGNLFQKTPFMLDKAFEYSRREETFVKRTGFVLMVQYVVHHKKSPDDLCLTFLQRIEEEAWDERNFVKKALNWCLRQIGKRSPFLHEKAMECAERIANQGTKSARWIAADALRELRSEAVHKRLGI